MHVVKPSPNDCQTIHVLISWIACKFLRSFSLRPSIQRFHSVVHLEALFKNFRDDNVLTYPVASNDALPADFWPVAMRQTSILQVR